MVTKFDHNGMMLNAPQNSGYELQAIRHNTEKLWDVELIMPMAGYNLTLGRVRVGGFSKATKSDFRRWALEMGFDGTQIWVACAGGLMRPESFGE